MTQRPRKPFRPAATPPQRFAVHPLSLAVLLTIAGPAYSLPQGGIVVGGQATIQNPSATLQVITQATNKAIIDWRSFSIGAGEKVRFDQPSSTAVLLNRVTGYEPTAIFGQMQSNGRIFLLNPYGVVFGANARIDVGGMVASTLALSNSDFLASNYSLASTPGAALGEVRNEGTISAPGGTVVLAGPRVTNTGSIEADRGRVGLAAASQVLVDVEGDGLVFFQAQATDAGNRLQQLGRIRADGGSVELRAAARGSMADTVLNMGGVVQARGLGTRNGRIVIDGGPEGITTIGGQVDATGAQAGQTGGDITVTGQKVLVDATARLDASGDAGGGRVRVGGGWQGHDADVRNAERVTMRDGATIAVDATGAGNGGTAVLWSDQVTRFGGAISARGGARGGDGGRIETSGKGSLEVTGRYDAGSPAGRAGNVLLDPTDIIVQTAPASPDGPNVAFGDSPNGGVEPMTVNPISITNAAATVTLQANNSITFKNAVDRSGTNNAGLIVQAGGNIVVQAALTTAGNGVGNTISLRANDPGGTTGLNGAVIIQSGGVLNANAGTILINNTGSTASNQIAANLTANGGIMITGPTQFSGTRTLASSTSVTASGLVSGTSDLTINGGGTVSLAGVNLTGSLTSTAGATTLNGNVTTSTTQSFGAVTLGNDAVLDGSTITIGGTVTGAKNLSLTPGAGGASLAAVTGITSLSASGTTTLNGDVSTTGAQSYATLALTGATRTLTTTGATANVTVTGPITGATGLTVTATGTAALSGGATVASLTTDGSGTTSLAGAITTTGNQAYNATTLTADTTLTASGANGIAFNAGLATSTHSLGLFADKLSLASAATGTGAITVGGSTNAKSIDVDVGPGGTGDLTIDGTQLGRLLGTGDLTIGRAAGTGAISVGPAGPFTLPGDLKFASANAAITFNGKVRGGNSLTIANGGTTTFLDTVGEGPGNALTSLSSTLGTTALAGNVTTSGAQTYGGVTVSGTTTLTAGAASSLGSLAGTGAESVTVAATGGATLGTVSALGSITSTTGTTTLNGNVNATTQNFGTVTLNGNRTLTGTTVTLGTATGAGNLTLSATNASLGANSSLGSLTATGAATTTLNGDVTTTGAQSYAGVTVAADATLSATSVTLGTTTTGANNLVVSAASTTLNGNVTGTGAQTYGAVTLGGPVALSGSALTVGAVTGGANAFSMTQSAASSVGTVNAGSFASSGAGKLTLGGNVTTATTQDYGSTGLAGSTTLRGSTITFNGAFTAGANNLALEADALSAPGSLSGTGNLRLAPRNAGDTISVASTAPAAATYSQGFMNGLAAGGFGSLTVGRADGTGAIDVGTGGTFTLPANFTVLAQNAPVTLGGTIDGNVASPRSLTVSTTGNTTVGATLTNLASLTIDGSSTLSGSITTTGAQTYTGAVTLGGTATLTGTTIGLGGGVTGAGFDLNVAASSGLTLANITGVDNLASTGAGLTTLGTGITTTGTQSYGAVALPGSRTLKGTTVTIGGNVTGSGVLTLDASSGASLRNVNNIGGVSAIGLGTTTLNGTVTTTGAQSYDAVDLAGNTTLAASGVTLGATTTGANNLVVSGPATLNGNVTGTGTQSYGAITLGGNATLTGSTLTVGSAVSGGAFNFGVAPTTSASLRAVTAANFTAAGTGVTTLGGDITTLGGTQNYAATNMSGPVSLTAQAITLNGAFSAGGNDLAMQTLGLGIGGSLSSTGGNFRLATPNAAGTLGLASAAATDLNISSGTLSLFTGFGFGSFTLGRADGTGAITVGTGGAVALPTNLTLLGSTSPVTLGGTITGNGHSLTVASSSGATDINATLSNLTTFSVAGPSTLQGNIATSVSQTFTGAVTLTGATTLTSPSLSFGGGGTSLNAQANNLQLLTRALSINAGVAGTGSATLGAFAAADTLGLGVAGDASFGASTIGKFGTFASLTLGRAADGTGAITAGALTLPTDTTIAANGASVDLNGAVTGAGHALTVATTGPTTVGTAPTGLSALTIDGPATLPGGTISTTGNQRYLGNVTLAGTQTLDAANIEFGGTLAIGANDLTLQYDGALTGPVSATGTGFVSLAPRTLGSTIGVAGGAGTFQVSQATLDGLTLFPNLGVGRADGTGLVTVGALTLPANFRLQSGSGDVQFGSGVAGGNNALTVNTGGRTFLNGSFGGLTSMIVSGATRLTGPTTIAAGSVNFGSTVDGNNTLTESLTINSSGATVFGGAVGTNALLPVLVTDAGGTTQLGGNVATTAAIFGDAVILAAPSTTVSGTQVNFNAGVNGTASGANALTVNGLTKIFAAGAGTTNALASLTLGVAGTSQLAGTFTTTGAQTFGGPVTLANDTTVNAGGTATFASTIDGARALTVTSPVGPITFGGNVGGGTALTSLTTAGPATAVLPALVRTTGAQTYGNTVTLAATSTLVGTDVSFAGAVNGSVADAQGLTVSASGATTFGSTVGATTRLASLTSNGGGTTALGGNVTTAGAQTYADAVTLPVSVTATGSTVQFGASVDGPGALTVGSPGLTAFAGPVGSTTPLASLTTDAAGTTQLGSTIRTSGTQTFGDAVTLTGATALTASGVTFASTVDGANTLQVNASGATTFGGNVGAGTALASLATDAPGTTTLPASVRTTGTQSFGDTVTLTAPATNLAASGIAFGGNLAAGASNLTTRSDALTLAGSATGTGTLDVATTTSAGTIGVGGGAGTLQLDAGLLGKFGTFSALTVGRADGTGAITAGSFALSAPTTFTGASAPVTFNGTVAGGGQPLSVTNGAATTVAGTLDGLASFTVPGTARFDGGSVTTTGAQTYGGAIALPGSATLTAGTAQFAAAIDGPGAMTVTTSGGASFAAPVGAGTTLAAFTVNGPAQLNGGAVSTAGAQTFGGALTLGAPTSLAGSTVSFGGAVDGAQLLSVTAGTTSFGAPVGAATPLAGLTTSGATQIAGNVTSSGAQSFGGAVTLTGDATLAAPTVTFGGAVDGAHALTTNAAGTTTFGGAVGATTALGSVTVANAAQLNGGQVTTTGAQAWGGPVTLGAATTLGGSNLSFASTVDGPGALAATATGTLSFGANVGGTAPLASLAATAAGGTTIAGPVVLTTGTQTFTGPVTLAGDVTAFGSSVAFNGAVDGAHALQVNASGATTFGSTVGATTALTSLATDAPGSTNLGGSVRTTGAQTYLDATTLTGDATLAATAVTFGSSLDGARALTVNAAATRFGGPVGATTALSSVTTDAAGTTRIGGNVSTTGAQSYADAVQLDANATLTATSLTLGGTVDGASTLTAAVSGTTTLNAAVGGTTALTGLSIGGATAMNAGSVTTTGGQAYTGPVALAGTTLLTSGNGVAFGATVDGAQALTIQTPGGTAFGASVGAATPLASLTVAGGGATSLAGASIDTTGTQSFAGNLAMSGNTRLTGSSLSFGGNVSGAQDLQLQTDALATAGGVAGSGVLRITPLTASTGIGIAGGAGPIQVSQALITSAGGFTQHVIGRADGSGSIDAGATTLSANTTLQTGTGNISLNGATNGGFDLTLNSGGITRITGPVGTTTALRSLVTDNQGGAGERTEIAQADASGSAQIVTTGVQTYGDTVAASVPVRFVGSTVTAQQAGNHFEGAVSGSVGSLALVDSGNVKLGDLSLANGGSVQAEGTIEVKGALALNGGTLTLRSNATPTGGAFNDPELAGKVLTFGASQLQEASATIFQSTGSAITSAPGSLLVLRTPKNGSLLFDEASNKLLGDVSAVAGTLNEPDTGRFGSSATTVISVLRLNSSEIHVAGAPPTDGNQAAQRAGLEADAIKLTADKLTTGTDGQIRARLPFDNLQGSQTSLPGLTLKMSDQALAIGGGFGTADPASWIQVKVGSTLGGYLTVRPKGANGDTAIILLSGADPKPFYDGAGKLTEVRVFYNGDTPRTPQESGALNAVIALVEEARHARFEEAVRTENVSSRLRSGVIAEVGSGRPATVGRESIKLPEVCEVPPGKLKCE